MDSPESSKPTTTNCETAPAQDSPFFSFISNLSPIQPVKAPSVTRSFRELNSPPLVFTSPRLNSRRQSIFLKRAHFPRASTANSEGHDEDGGNSDIGNVDSIDTRFLNNSTFEKSDYFDQPPDARTDSMGNLVEFECETNSRTTEQQVETEEVLEEITLIDVSAVGNNTKQGDCPEIEHQLPVGHASTNQSKDSMIENAEAEETGHPNQSYHLPSRSSEIGKEDQNFVAKSTGAPLTVPVLKRAQNDHEAFQHRGVRRRCLQFEDAQKNVLPNQTAQNTSDSEELRTPSLKPPSIPIHGKNDVVSHLMLCPINSYDPAVKTPKPSGIGLHLNSIVNTVQSGSGSIINVRSSQRGNVSIFGKKSTHMNDAHLSDFSNNSSVLPMIENVLASSTDDIRHGNPSSVGVDSAVSLSTFNVEPSNESVVLSSLRDQSTTGNKRKCLEKNSGSEELNKSSPQKKRMEVADPSEGDGCKRCNCRKSKCLKLYCDCFAAGIYCADPCACQECLNRPKYVDIVLETRQKIESRDPLAFAPRVVKRKIEQPSNSRGENGSKVAPSLARHKRGCKCKKSMCLKKYCECYQANIGCSDGCRCEGCQNVFGQKGEYRTIRDVFSDEDSNVTINGLIPEKYRTTTSGNGINHTEHVNAHNLTPPTPAFQFSNHGKDASKACFPSGEYSQSPDSGFADIGPYMISPRSSINSDSNDAITENTQEIEILDVPTFENWADNSKSQPFSAKRHYYPPGGSLGWCRSPNTPVPQFSGTKLLRDFDFDTDFSSNSVQDDTPEILKDSCTPLNGVKVCSPNKKRVSPPQGRPREFGSGSSAGLRTGRKFILKAVPSFPPLTPCIDSRTLCGQQAKDPQDRRVNK